MMTTNNDDDSTSWTFSISLGDGNGINDGSSSLPTPPDAVCEAFRRDGFAVFPHVLQPSLVHDLNEQLEEILRGRYDRGKKPDKVPKIIKSEYNRYQNHTNGKNDQEHTTNNNMAGNDSSSSNRNCSSSNSTTSIGPLGFNGNLQNVKVLQVINVHKANHLFRQLVTHPALGKVVADLARWGSSSPMQNDKNKDNDNVVVVVGVRLAQDQVWAKPPGAPPLTFHRDTPYFMFTPNDVVTVWIALDDMDTEIGPLEYVRGSHVWGDGRVGSANQFFQPDRGLSLLQSAAAREGIDDDDAVLEIVSMAGLQAGGISIHDGRTWHGSGRNNSCNRPRRGLGIHFVPANVRFTPDATKSRLWKHYVEGAISNDDVSKVELSDEDFPITWGGAHGAHIDESERVQKRHE
jgi:Phytanoyl-CoA dioxygenase (PhyH)